MSETKTIGAKEFKSGFTWKSYLAIIYAAVVFQPGLLYLFLATGNAAMFVMVQWSTLILFTELCRMLGTPLTRQEAATIFLGSGLASTFSGFLGWIYNLYLRNSPVVASFGLTEAIPPWFAPASPDPWLLRTFFHSSWFLPLAVGLVHLLCTMIGSISLGFLARQVFIVEEKLPFPLQVIPAQTVNTLTEREPSGMHVLAITTIISMIYGIITYAAPMIAGELGYPFRVVPIPWVDLNRRVHMVLPGASFGIATDLLPLAWGFLIPLNIILSMLIGSIAIFIVGNWFLVTQGITQFAEEWAFGMNIQLTWQRSLLYAWACPLIGVALAAGLMPLIRHPRVLTRAFKTLLAPRKKGKTIPAWVILAPFLFSSIASTVMVHLLIPEFPLWILLILSIGWSPLYVLISSRAIGVAGFSVNIPYLSQFIYIASGYPKYDIWFTPLYIEQGSPPPGAGWCATFKVAELCGIRPTSYIKFYLAALPLTMLLSFIFTSEFWRLAPIPSAVYPGVQIFWPIEATMQMIWVKRPPGIFHPEWIVGGFISMAGLHLVCGLLNLPLSIISVAAGVAIPPPTIVTVLIGYVIARLVARNIGKEWWAAHRAVASAGLILGEGLVIVAASAITMIVRSAWYMPY